MLNIGNHVWLMHHNGWCSTVTGEHPDFFARPGRPLFAMQCKAISRRPLTWYPQMKVSRVGVGVAGGSWLLLVDGDSNLDWHCKHHQPLSYTTNIYEGLIIRPLCKIISTFIYLSATHGQLSSLWLLPLPFMLHSVWVAWPGWNGMSLWDLEHLCT